jgi:hypothetical protein
MTRSPVWRRACAYGASPTVPLEEGDRAREARSGGESTRLHPVGSSTCSPRQRFDSPPGRFAACPPLRGGQFGRSAPYAIAPLFEGDGFRRAACRCRLSRARASTAALPAPACRTCADAPRCCCRRARRPSWACRAPGRRSPASWRRGSSAWLDRPVTFAPGRARLAMSPWPTHRIGDRRHDDRCRGGGRAENLLRRARGGCAGGDHNVERHGLEPAHDVRDFQDAPLGVAALDRQVAALDEAARSCGAQRSGRQHPFGPSLAIIRSNQPPRQRSRTDE